MTKSSLPVEVELVYEVMPCNAMRVGQEPIKQAHPCGYFRKWGTYHSFDYVEDGPPHKPGIAQPAKYVGRAPLLPELVSGCRKAPILAVGINPNLPGWARSKRGSLNPLFDDYRQYAHFFRYRAAEKLEIPRESYNAFGGGAADTPDSRFELEVPVDGAGNRVIPTALQPQAMYEGYQWLLEEMARLAGWTNHRLALGEDLAYGNMVACPSARWITRPNPDDPAMPPMTVSERDGIVGECFADRRYFLRQLFQSLPGVILVFSESTARAFNRIMRDRLIADAPGDNEPFDDMVRNRRTVLRYGTAGGEELTARVIYSPHISGTPEQFKQRRGLIAAELHREVKNKRIELNPLTGNLRRPAGSCVFCPMLDIGKCDYEAELRPLVDAPQLLAAGGPDVPPPDKAAQQALLGGSGTNRTLVATAFAIADAPPEGAAGVAALAAAGAEVRAGAEALTLDRAPPFVAPGFFAGEVDEDRSATYVLTGRIVTLDAHSTVHKDGWVAVRDGQIVAVDAKGKPLPAGFAGAKTVATGGTIYPGLIDLHNHFVYNALTLWDVPGTFERRAQWQGKLEYRKTVSGPMQILSGISLSSRAIVRFIEAKAVLGGTTTGQGMMTRINGRRTLFNGMMRNVELTRDQRLPEASTRVPDLRDDPDEIASFAKSLATKEAVFYHLCEGLDPASRKPFELISSKNLLKPSLVGIHALALQPADYAKLRAAGAKIVWSPLSNLLLYGKTLDIKAVKESGVTVSLGCDWAPSGSKNPLQELKVARHMNRAAGSPFSAEGLVRMVTSAAADAVAWSKHVGSVTQGKLADLVVIAGTDGDPYDHLIDARERDVSLVVIHGNARYGDKALVETLSAAGTAHEKLDVNGTAKLFDFTAPGSGLEDLTLARAIKDLKEAMADLPAFRREHQNQRANLMALGIPAPEAFTLELDNEHPEDGPPEDAPQAEASLFAAIDDAAKSVKLDSLFVSQDDLVRIEGQRNLSQGLKNELKQFYT